MVGGELARLTPADLGQFGQVVLSPIRRQSITSPLLRLPSDGLCYAFNLVRIPATDDAAEAVRLVAANRAVYDGSAAPAARCTRSARSRCPATTGASTSGRPSTA